MLVSRPRQGRIRAAAAIAVAVFLLALPSSAAAASAPPKLDARAWVLIDPRDDSVLAANAPNKRLPIASATKLMTAYLALHNLKPSQMVTAPGYQASNPAEITLGLRGGERIRVRDLLYGLLLPSASDAAITLADAVSGSVPAFVQDMNRTAQKLGLSETSYANPIGLDDPDNYSSAHDLVTLASILLRNRLFARIVNTPAATLSSGDHPRTVTSRNTLLGQEPWVNGVKTGHTLGAGYVLVGSGTRGSTTLISAVLGTPSEYVRDQSTLELLDYGFSLYRPVDEVTRGEEIASPKLDYRSDHLPLLAARPITVTVRQGQRVSTRVRAPGEVSGDVGKGQRLGSVTVFVDGERAAVSPLVAAHAVGAATTLDKVQSAVLNPIVLIGLAAIVILVGLLLTLRARGNRTPGDPEPRAQEPQRSPRQRTPEERRRMHEERMRRRRQRMEREGGTG
ncbi:MAG TPA: D-alanyl-D-alanine carboxypeptidase family protein [Solirubrobacterales bacterium]|nr:D-alanyl-D-alanine carboxypeptidase family protein [Solirubrobacterales bacterium]